MGKKIVIWQVAFVTIICLSSITNAQPPIQVTHEVLDLSNMTFAWSPNSDQFAYVALCNSEVKLYRIDLDGTNKTFLADSVLISYGCPVDWKGSYVVFKAQSATGSGAYAMLLRRIKPDGTNEKTLYGPYWYGDYVLRPGGGWLLFREAPAGWWVARRIDMNGSNVKTVSHNSLVQGIGWLGKTHILYTRGANYNTPCKLYKVDFNGGNLKELTPSWLAPNIQFSASPNSSKILYCDGTAANWDVWIMNSDGSNKKQLTFHQSSEYLSWPLENVWSADSESFYFVSERSGKRDIYRMNVNGTGLTQITFSDSIDYMPNVSPDGKKLAFLSKRDGYTNIWYFDFEKIHVSIPDTIDEGNKIVNIPVYVTDLTNKGIYSLGMTVTTNPAILIPQGAVTTGTLSEPWGSATYNINGGTMKIGMAGSTPLSGSGKLIYLRYKVPDSVAPNSTTPITITNFVFNDEHPAVVLHNGSFTVARRYDVSGNIKYFSNNVPIPGVDVKLDGHQTTTGNSGDFQFLDVLYGNYTLRPEKAGASSHAVGPYDAAMILLSTVKLIALTPYQKIAADVSDNGQVSSYDASYVLRYYVRLIPEFPVGKDWTFVPTSFPITSTDWAIAPDSIRYQPLNSDKTNQNFVGIVYGDVSGNWSVPSSAQEYLLAHGSSQPQLTIGSLQQEEDGRFILPIEVTEATDLVSLGLTCQYDQSQFKFVAARLKNPSVSQPMFFSHEQDGTIRLALASANPINNRATTIKLIFKPKESKQNLHSGTFSIQDLSINGKYYQIQAQQIEAGLESAVPERYELSQNFPNPFNAETLIKYQLPNPGHVTIRIYNLLGQKIQTLVDGVKEAGFHQVNWNGQNDWNEAIGSGEYLCQMQVGDFVAVRKVVLIR
jgi:Tol biopolymer transport system component